MTIISYGEEKPIAMGDSEEAYAKNRRVNFVPLSQ
jgi:outer membrane protein OmpA-like peptidoglycan-associated protein